MSEITNIIAGLKNNMSTILGPDYSELSNATDISMNSFKGSNKRYGVLSKSVDEVAGVTCHVTVDQLFDLILTDGYYTKNTNDLDKRNKTINLQELAFSIYKEVVNTKAGTPGTVMTVDTLTIAEPEYLEEDHVVAITATITIKYRKAL